MPGDTDFHTRAALTPDLEVAFVHEGPCSEAFVRRRDRVTADGYELRLKSWDDRRTAREVIESNLIARLTGAYGLKASARRA